MFPASSTASSDAGTSGSSGSAGSSSPGSGDVQYKSYGEQPGRDEWLYLNITTEFALKLQQQVQQHGQVPSTDGQHTEL